MRNIRTLTIAVLGSMGLSILAGGCAADRNKDIPASAQIVAQGEKELAYRAPEDGTIYVFDKSGQNVLYSGRVQRDDLLKVEAMRDRITLNNRVVMDKQIRDHDALNVFFEREPRSASMDVRPASERTVIREREIRTEPRTELRSEPSDSTITIRPNGDRVTVDGNSDSKVTVEQPGTDSKVTIERGGQDR
jgi:hypothetical protein